MIPCWPGSFWRGLTSLGDLDCDGVTDLAMGSFLDDDGGYDRGAVRVLFLEGHGSADGTCESAGDEPGVTEPLNNGAC
ncbi:unnamed protein product, partial [marine sediment metagenome]